MPEWLDFSVGLDVIFGAGVGIWWASKMNSKVSSLEDASDKTNTRFDAFDEKLDKISEDLHELMGEVRARR